MSLDKIIESTDDNYLCKLQLTRVFITNIVSQNGEPQLNCGKGKLSILSTYRRLSINNVLPKNAFDGGRQQGVAPLTALGARGGGKTPAREWWGFPSKQAETQRLIRHKTASAIVFLFFA